MQRYKDKSKQDKETLIETSSSTSECSTSSESIKEITERVEQLEKLLASSSQTSVNGLSISSGSDATLLYIKSEDYVNFLESFQSGPSCSYDNRDVSNHNEERYHKSKNRTDQKHPAENISKPFQQTCQAYDQFVNVRRMPANRQPTVYRKETGSRQAARTVDVEREFKNYDTLHYLAQGEFAPVDDGVKLTPSREAVLSDIIWEDVCRAHWPSIRLIKNRSSGRKEKLSQRNELQRQIDVLLRERSARAEKRKRRHQRTKLNNFDQNRNANQGYMLSAETKTAVSTRKYTSDDCVMIEEINKKVSPDRNHERCYQRPTGSLDISEAKSKRYETCESRRREKKSENSESRERKIERNCVVPRVEKRVQNVEAVQFPHSIERRSLRTPEVLSVPEKRLDRHSKRNANTGEVEDERSNDVSSGRRQKQRAEASSRSNERKRKKGSQSRHREQQSISRSGTPVVYRKARATQYHRQQDSSAGPSNTHKQK